MDIGNFLLNRGYVLDSKTITKKGRGKMQFYCLIDKRPTNDDLLDCEDEYGIDILKCQFKKGRELTILMKERDQDQKRKIDIQYLTVDNVLEIIYDKELTRQEVKEILIQFQTSCFQKGFNTHKEALRKFLE